MATTTGKLAVGWNEYAVVEHRHGVAPTVPTDLRAGMEGALRADGFAWSAGYGVWLDGRGLLAVITYDPRPARDPRLPWAALQSETERSAIGISVAATEILG